MDTFFIIVFGVFMIALGRIALKNWYNHLTIYSTMWTIVLSMNSLRLIKYHLIIPEAWIIIIAAWIALYLGTAVVVLAPKVCNIPSSFGSISKDSSFARKSNADFYVRTLKIAIIVLSIIGIVGLVAQWYNMMNIFGSIVGAMAHAYLRYQLRIRGATSGIPYLSSFLLAAVSLAGIYSALKNRITFTSILPMLLVTLQSITLMGRAMMFIAMVLFTTSYLFSLKYLGIRIIELVKRKNTILAIVIVGLALFTAEQIKTTRGVIESYKKYGESESLENLRKIPLITPSIYFYFSGTPVVFSEYLREGGEDVYIGWYTFAPVYRFLAKFNLAKRPSYYQDFYSTPVPMNTGTYLREVHADFGEAGVLIFPFLLGLVCTIIFAVNHFRLIHMVFLAHLYVVVVMTYVCNTMSLGYLLISLIVSAVIAISIERNLCKRKCNAGFKQT